MKMHREVKGNTAKETQAAEASPWASAAKAAVSAPTSGVLPRPQSVISTDERQRFAFDCWMTKGQQALEFKMLRGVGTLSVSDDRIEMLHPRV